MHYPTITEKFQEQLDILRYLARDKKCPDTWPHKPFGIIDKDFERIIKMKGLGKELRPNSYKSLKLSHHNHGSDNWEIRLSAERMIVRLNRENWVSFQYWVRSLRSFAPNRAETLVRKYPHVRVSP